MHQSERTRTLKHLRDGRMRVLVATDVAARGIDVPGINLVVNYDAPRQAEDYVHRIGRTGRAGRAGIAVTFLGARETAPGAQIERFTGNAVSMMVIPGLEPAHAPSAPRVRVTKAAGAIAAAAGKCRQSGTAARGRRTIGGAPETEPALRSIRRPGSRTSGTARRPSQRPHLTRVARQPFLPGKEPIGLPCVGMNGAAGPAGFFGCLGFLASRLLRC